MTVYGRCKMNIILDQVSIYCDDVISEIWDEELMSMDILKGKDGKPADIILSQCKYSRNKMSAFPANVQQKCQNRRRVCYTGSHGAIS